MAGPDFLDTLKDIEDVRAIGRATSTQERMLIHERMAQRQRERENHEALQKANEIANRQEQYQRAQARRLREQQEAEDAERRRRAALPRCPVCQTPLEGNQPRRCAACRVDIYWILGSPFGGQGISQGLHDGLRQRLDAFLETLRSSAIALERSVTRTGVVISLKPCGEYEDRLNEWSRRACEEETVLRQRLKDLGAQTLKLRKPMRDAENAVKSLKPNQGCGLVVAGTLAICALYFFNMAQWDGPLGAKLGAYCFAVTAAGMTVAFVFNAMRLPTQVQTERAKLTEQNDKLSHQEDEQRRALQTFEVSIGGDTYSPCRICQNRAFLQTVVAAHGAAPAGQAISELFLKSSGTCRFGDSDASAECFIDEAIASAALVNALAFVKAVEGDCAQIPGGEGVLPQDVRDRLSLIRTTAGRANPNPMQLSRDTATLSVPDNRIRPLPSCFVKSTEDNSASERNHSQSPAEEVMGALLLESLCCIAVADKKVNQPEVTRIVEALEKLGVRLPKERLQSVAVDACKNIHAKGVQAYSKALCSRLVSLGRAGLCAIILEWQKKVLVVDGDNAESEMEIARIFEEQLADIVRRAGGPDYSDLCVSEGTRSL